MPLPPEYTAYIWWLQNLGQPFFVDIIAILVPLCFESYIQNRHC